MKKYKYLNIELIMVMFLTIINSIIINIVNINNSFAAPSAQQLLNQQLILQQQQEQRRQQEQNQLQIDDAENIRKTRIGSDGIESIDGNNADRFGMGEDGGDGSSSDGSGSSNLNCIKFNKIEIVGNKIYSTRYLNRKVLNKYIDKCINKKNIDAITNSLMKIYIDKGYSTTRVYFDISRLKSENIFIFVIDEGKVNDIILNNVYPEKKEKAKKENNKEKKEKKKKENFQSSIFNFQFPAIKSFRLKTQTFFAFPLMKNKTFNLKDFEQGLDQLNRLQSNNAILDIKPVLEIENGKLKIENEPSAENQKNKNKLNKNKSSKSISLTNSYSNIIITNQKSRSTYLDFGIDNSGNKITGERLASISISQDNLLAFDDNIYLKYTQDIDTENSKRYNKSFYGNISIPLGYWTFNPSISYSKYLTTINGYYTNFHTSGNTLTQMYNIDRVMYRNQLYKLNLGSNLTIRDTESYIRDLKSQTGSRKSSNISLYLNNIIYTKLGTIILKPSYQKGLDWFNSKKDENHSLMLKTEPRLQYDMVKLYAYYNTRINLPLWTKMQVVDPNTGKAVMVEKEIENGKLKIENEPSAENNNKPEVELVPLKVRNKINLNYTLTFDSQYSWNTLYGTDQFSIGGEYTVRGFREATISGDNGYYIRNDLRINLQQLFPRILLNTKIMNYGRIIKGKNIALSINDFLSKIYLSIFYDYGYVKDKYSDSSDIQYNSQSGHMSGTGIALNYYGRYLNWSLTYAKALHSPNYLQSRDGIEKEGHSLYWRVGGRF